MTRADFVAFCESTERDEWRSKIKDLNNMIDSAEKRWNGVEEELKFSRQELAQLKVKKAHLQQEFKIEKEKDRKNEEILVQLRQSVKILTVRCM